MNLNQVFLALLLALLGCGHPEDASDTRTAKEPTLTAAPLPVTFKIRNGDLDPNPSSPVLYVCPRLDLATGICHGLCTGSVVDNGRQRVLTAAHCVDTTVFADPTHLAMAVISYADGSNPDGAYSVSRVTKATRHPKFVPTTDGTSTPENGRWDAAVLELATALPAQILPVKINGCPLPLTGKSIGIVGFGAQADNTIDYKRRRGTSNVVNGAYFPEALIVSVPSAKNQLICGGDSGGPAYVYDSALGKDTIVGVTQSSDVSECGMESWTIHASTGNDAAMRSFLRGALPADAFTTASCATSELTIGAAVYPSTSQSSAQFSGVGTPTFVPRFGAWKEIRPSIGPAAGSPKQRFKFTNLAVGTTYSLRAFPSYASDTSSVYHATIVSGGGTINSGNYYSAPLAGFFQQPWYWHVQFVAGSSQMTLELGSTATSGTSRLDFNHFSVVAPTTVSGSLPKPQPPANVTVTTTSAGPSLAWQASEAASRTYLVVRRAGSAVVFEPTPEGIYSGAHDLGLGQKVVAITTSLAFVDTTATTGTYFYKVFAADPLRVYSVGVNPTSSVGVHRLFASSKRYLGNFGGLEVADSQCNQLATAAGIGGSWKALMSGNAVNAKDRVVITKKVVDMYGNLLALNAQDLWDGSIGRPIAYTEKKTAVDWHLVFTGTRSNGARDQRQYSTNCGASRTSTAWTVASPGLGVETGRTDRSDTSWIAIYDANATQAGNACSNEGLIYCIEQ